MTASAEPTILLFAEDPGGANLILQIARLLKAHSCRVLVLTDGVGTAYLRERGCQAISINNESPATWLSRSGANVVISGTSTNPKSFGLRLMHVARTKDIPTIGAVDAVMSASFRFRGETEDPLFFAPDWLLVPDGNTGLAYSQLGFSAGNILEMGFPHYADVEEKREALDANRRQNKLRILPVAASKRKVLVFVAEPPLPFGQDSIADNVWRGWGETRERTHVALQETLDIVSNSNSDCFFVLRLHPRDNAENYRLYKNRIDYISSGEKGLELVSIADLIVGTTSSLLFEAVVLNRPVISAMVCSCERQWLPSVIASEISIANEPAALANYIRKFLAESQNTSKPARRFEWDERGKIIELVARLSPEVRHSCSVGSAS